MPLEPHRHFLWSRPFYETILLKIKVLHNKIRPISQLRKSPVKGVNVTLTKIIGKSWERDSQNGSFSPKFWIRIKICIFSLKSADNPMLILRRKVRILEKMSNFENLFLGIFVSAGLIVFSKMVCYTILLFIIF